MPKWGEGCEGDLCSASVASLGCLLPYLISWGLTYVHHIGRFSCPLNSDSIWLVATTSRISERESLALHPAGSPPSGHCQISCVSEGDVSWQLALPVQLLSPNFCLLLLALGMITTLAALSLWVLAQFLVFPVSFRLFRNGPFVKLSLISQLERAICFLPGLWLMSIRKGVCEGWESLQKFVLKNLKNPNVRRDYDITC